MFCVHAVSVWFCFWCNSLARLNHFSSYREGMKVNCTLTIFFPTYLFISSSQRFASQVNLSYLCTHSLLHSNRAIKHCICPCLLMWNIKRVVWNTVVVKLFPGKPRFEKKISMDIHTFTRCYQGEEGEYINENRTGWWNKCDWLQGSRLSLFFPPLMCVCLISLLFPCVYLVSYCKSSANERMAGKSIRIFFMPVTFTPVQTIGFCHSCCCTELV